MFPPYRKEPQHVWLSLEVTRLLLEILVIPVVYSQGMVRYSDYFLVKFLSAASCHNECVQVVPDNSYIHFIGRQMIYPPITSQTTNRKGRELKGQEGK